MYDLIIIGMGPAGMSAAIYAIRANLKVLVLEKDTPGGLLLKLKEINNYLGFKKIDGPDLAFKMFEHFNSLEIPYNIEEVMEIENKEKTKIIKTNKNTYKANNILITTGMNRKKSNKIDDLYLGKGVSYCTICDAPLYKNKIVAVVGNKEAFNDALYLSDIAQLIYFISDEEVENKKENIKIINSSIKSLEKKDNKFLINIHNIIEVDGVFINYGMERKSNFDKQLDIRNEKGFIVVDKNMETKEKGIYAAGDVIKKDFYQICTAVSEGGVAVNNIKNKKDTV